MRLVRRRGRNGTVKFVGQYTKGALAFSIGSQVLSNPAFGSIGQQGAQGLAAGASFFPVIGTIGGATIVGRQLKRLKRSARLY